MVEFVKMRAVDEDVGLEGRPSIVLIDKRLVDMKDRVLMMVEDILECLDSSKIEVNVMRFITVRSLSVEVMGEADGAVEIKYDFRLVTPCGNYHVSIYEGEDTEYSIDNMPFLSHVEFVGWVKKQMGE